MADIFQMLKFALFIFLAIILLFWPIIIYHIALYYKYLKNEELRAKYLSYLFYYQLAGGKGEWGS